MQACYSLLSIFARLRLNAEDADKLFRVLSGYYSWFNFDLIKYIINTFCETNVKVCTELSK